MCLYNLIKITKAIVSIRMTNLWTQLLIGIYLLNDWAKFWTTGLLITAWCIITSDWKQMDLLK